MTLTLRAVSLNDHPLTQPITAHFDAEGGSIGRSDHNTLALPDPERHISRHHAEIVVGSGGYLIKNVGSANPIVVRGQALARGQSAPLEHRDQVRIGGYLLDVIHEDAADDEANTVVRGRASVDALTPGFVRRTAALQGGAHASPPVAAHGGGGDLGAPLSSSNPFAGLIGGPTPPPDAHPAGAPPGVRRRVEPARPLLPEDFDPFAMPAPAPPPSATPQGGGSVFEDLLPGVAPASIDRFIELQGGGRDSLADFTADLLSPPHGAGAATGSVEAGLSTDPLALFGSGQAVDPAQGPTLADDVPQMHSAFIPSAVRAEPDTASRRPVRQAAAAPAPSQPEGQGQGDAGELWRAFCDGAGIAAELPQGSDPEMMRVVGALLSAAVQGTLQLMSVRATVKYELHAQVTMIRTRDNNPLKFSPDARSALEQMLQPPLRGFLAGPAAMTDAMHDLVGHSIGTMAGTRAALEGVLDRFAPRQLEAKLVGKTMLDSLLPMNRKAKLWELYLQQFEAIRGEAQDDFHSLFGKAFLAAYEQQLDRLKRGDPGPA